MSLHDTHGLHHFHQRKRMHEPFPHPDKFKRLMDRIIYVIAIIGPVMTLPQVGKIWYFRNAAGVSIISWLTYMVCAVFWVIYGIIHKEKPIVFTNVLWIVIDAFVVAGTILYG